MKCAGCCTKLWTSNLGFPAARLGPTSSLLASLCLDSVFWGSLYMHALSTWAVLLFCTPYYIYGSHHTITSMLKYVHSSAQTCGSVGRRRYCLGCFGGHLPAPPSSYALRRHGSHWLALHAQTNYHIHGRRGTTPTLEISYILISI